MRGRTSADSCPCGEIICTPSFFRCLRVGANRKSLVVENRFISCSLHVAAATFGDFVKAQRRATVELPAGEFLELSKQISSVARAVCVRSHKFGISAKRQNPMWFRE